MEYTRVNNGGAVLLEGSMREVSLDEKDANDNPDVTKRNKIAGLTDSWRRWLRLESCQNQAPQRGWKPLSMTTPILASIAILSLLIAAAIETITQQSQMHGGLALSASQDDIPRYAMLSYLYVPNICAVLYSLVWSWVDLDVKRVQAWLELSKPEGATAENSLFLDYAYDFVAFVPIKSARKKHWPVFLTGTIMMVIFWLITPLQSAILGTEEVIHTENLSLFTQTKLRPVEEQTALLNSKVMSAGYDVAWLDQPMPPFTTPDIATLPFYFDNDPSPVKSLTNWTAETTSLSTELRCWLADVTNTTPQSGTYSFTNGQGCNATVSIGLTSNYTMLYIGYWSSPFSDYFLAGPNCPATSDVVHQFLSVWAQKRPGEDVGFDITGLFCQPQYFKQNIQVTVDAAHYKLDVKKMPTLGARDILSPSEFNSSAFEFLLANGMDQNPLPTDYPFKIVVEQQPKLAQTGLQTPVSNMVGFALAGQNRSAADYSDPSVLHDAYERAHKYLFSIAVSMLLANSTVPSDRAGTSTYPLSGITASRVFSAVVEGLLVLVALCAVILAWLCHTAPCELGSNPSSISRLTSLLRESDKLRKAFNPMDGTTNEELVDYFRNDKFRLYHPNDDPTALGIERLGDNILTFVKPKSPEKSTQKGYYEAMHPVALRRDIGAAFVAILISVLVVLSYLKRREDIDNGLSRPTENFEVLQLLENYIPTIFATLIEPFWVLLNRLLCMVQPFKELWLGKAKRSSSIDATYTSIPPQLAFLRAIKSRHYILSGVCIITLLCNVLAVGLGALFNENSVQIAYSREFHPTLDAKFNNKSVIEFGVYLSEQQTKSPSYQDHMYIALANISSGTPLPPWVTPTYFLQPFVPALDANDKITDTYRIMTRGFGLKANCSAIPTRKIPINVDAMDKQDMTTCTDLVGYARATMRKSILTRPSGRSAIEYSQTWSVTKYFEPCAKPLTIGWGRTPAGEDMNATIEASFAVCHPVFETAMFEATIDRLGNVLSYDKKGPAVSTLGYNESNIHTDAMIAHFNRQMNTKLTGWHNDTLSQDWLNHFIGISTSRASLNPNATLPSADATIPAIEDIYRRLFAILLGLNQHVFEKGDASASITASRLTKETRIFIDGPAFIVTIVILGLNIIAACIFYFRAVDFSLPRMPTTIGSIFAYVAPSKIANEQYQRSSSGKFARTFSFGRFVGCDGMVHLGIEMDPHVVLVHSSIDKEGSNGGCWSLAVGKDHAVQRDK